MQGSRPVKGCKRCPVVRSYRGVGGRSSTQTKARLEEGNTLSSEVCEIMIVWKADVFCSFPYFF